MWKQQKLIRDAEMTIEVDEVEGVTKEVEAVARRHDGIVADREAWQDRAGNRQSSMRVRVPAAHFDAAMAELRDLGTVTREKISTEDVTKAYTDLETRLSVKRTAEERLRAILSSRTGSLSDVLEAERELSRVTGEIEQLLGEKKYYDQRIAISTILVALRSTNEIGPSVFSPLRDALRESLSTLSMSLGLLIYVLVFLAPWLVLGISLFWLVKKLRRRRSAATSP